MLFSASKIIQKSSSPFSSPLMLVRKAVPFDEKDPLKCYRVVLDYRRINANTVPDSYPMRNIYEMIDDFTVALADGIEMQKHTGIHLQDGKYVAVLFHETDIPLPYKLISNDDLFEEEVAFFRMKNPEPQVL